MTKLLSARLTTALLAAALFTTAPVFAQDYDALIQQAVTQRNAGDMAAAEATLRQAYAIPSDKTEVSYLLGMVLAFQQRYDEALDLIIQALQQNPDNTELQLARARVLSFQGLYREAAETTDAVLAREPRNIEARNLAGRIALYQQRPGSARERFNEVLQQEPEDLEAMIGLYDSLYALGERVAANEQLARAAALYPGHIDVLSRQSPAEFSTNPRHQVTAGGARSTIDRPGFADWNDRFIEYRHLQANNNQQYLRVEHDHRFGTHDTMIEAGVALGQSSSLPVEVAVGFTPNDEFLAEYFARLSASHVLVEGSDSFGTLVFSGGYQHTSYANGKTHRLFAGFEYYLPGVDVWLTPSFGVVRDQDGTNTFAWGLGANWQVAGGTRIGVNYSDAPETENLVTTDTTVWGAYLQQDLGSRVRVFLGYNRSDRENAYVRESIDLALQTRF
jgi:YaiO family outer membrane protein